MAERRMPEIMCQRYRLDQVFVQTEITGHGSSDLCDFYAVGQPGTEQIAFMIDEYLGLVFETAERGGVNDAVTIPLEFRAAGRGCFGELSAARSRGIGGISRQFIHARLHRRELRANPPNRNPMSRKLCPGIEAKPDAAGHFRLFCHAP